MAGEPPRYVLDSFALIAFLEGEAGAAEVEQILQRAQGGEARVSISVVNLGEVVYITEREQGLDRALVALAAVEQLPIQVIDADRKRSLSAAHVKANHPISYADAFAVSLAQEEDATLVTGDPEIRELTAEVELLWLPRSETGG